MQGVPAAVLRATYRQSRCRVKQMGSSRFEGLLDSTSFLATRTARGLLPCFRGAVRKD